MIIYTTFDTKLNNNLMFINSDITIIFLTNLNIDNVYYNNLLILILLKHSFDL